MDELVRFIQVLSDDKRLRDWILKLNAFPENLRVTQIGQMIEQMKDGQERKALIEFIDRLKDKSIFDAVIKTLKEINL